MKHGGSTSGRSSKRGKCQQIFFNAWNLHDMKPFPHGHEKGETAFRGIYKLIERFISLHGVITPHKVFE